MSTTNSPKGPKRSDESRDIARESLLPVARGRVYSSWDIFVTFMRRTLPVLALIAALLTVGYPLLNDNQVSFTLSTDDVMRGDDTVHMRALKYRGSDASNRLFTITAESGLQKDPNADVVSLSAISASIQMKDAGLALVGARTGRYQKKDGQLTLIGGVNLETSGGYSLTMSGADVFLKGRKANGSGGIQGQTPIGKLSADNFEVDVENSIATFSGRVTLRIVPKRTP